MMEIELIHLFMAVTSIMAWMGFCTMAIERAIKRGSEHEA